MEKMRMKILIATIWAGIFLLVSGSAFADPCIIGDNMEVHLKYVRYDAYNNYVKVKLDGTYEGTNVVYFVIGDHIRDTNELHTIMSIALAALTTGKRVRILLHDCAAKHGYSIFIYSYWDKPYQTDFSAGWYMISLPVTPITTDVADLFPEALVVYSFERGTGYRRTNNLEVGKGYWILFNKTRSYELRGQPITGYGQMIEADGWSMIGGCTKPAQAKTDGCSIEVIYKYKPGIGYQRVLSSEDILPCQGYWISLSGIEGECELKVEAIE